MRAADRRRPFFVRAQDQDLQTKQDEKNADAGKPEKDSPDTEKALRIPYSTWSFGGLLAWAAFVGRDVSPHAQQMSLFS